MKNNTNQVPIQEVRYIEKITEQEIAQQWVRKQWFNPQAKFDGDLVVFMAKKWCIKCQKEVEHAAIYCHGECGNNCNHRCSVCGLETLANIQVNTGDTGNAVIKWAVGEAQRKAQRTGATGDIKITVWDGNVDTGLTECKIVVYNTTTRNYKVIES